MFPQLRSRRPPIALTSPASADVTVGLTGVSAAASVGALGVALAVALSGLAGTTAAGSVSPATTIGLTGNGATGAVGTVSTGSAVTQALTGVAGTAAVGGLTPSTTIGLTGNTGTGAVGNVSASVPGSSSLSGVSATGAAGTIGPQVTIGISGVGATGACGSMAGSGPGSAALTGVQATGAVGSVTASGGDAHDSSDIDAALIAKLRADATLAALMPDGVFFDEAPGGATRFIIVSLVTAADVQQFGGRDHEDVLYLVKAVGLSSRNPAMKAAAARIDALLDGGTLTITGYALMVMQREERVRFTEVDDDDRSIRWAHRGGHYRVMAAPA